MSTENNEEKEEPDGVIVALVGLVNAVSGDDSATADTVPTDTVPPVHPDTVKLVPPVPPYKPDTVPTGTDKPATVPTGTVPTGTVPTDTDKTVPDQDCAKFVVDVTRKEKMQYNIRLLNSLVNKLTNTPAIHTLTLTNPDFKQKIKPMIDALTGLMKFISRDDTINKIFCYRSILDDTTISIADKLKIVAGKLFADIVEQTKDYDLSEFLDPVISNVSPLKRELKIMFSILIEDTDFVPLPNEFKRLLKIMNHFVTLLIGTVSETSSSGLFSLSTFNPLELGEEALLKMVYTVASPIIKNNPEGIVLISTLKSLVAFQRGIHTALCVIESMLPSLNAESIKTFKDAYDSNMNKAKLNQVLGLLQEIVLHHGNDKIDPITCPTAGEMITSASASASVSISANGGGYREKKRKRKSTRKKHAKQPRKGTRKKPHKRTTRKRSKKY